MLAIDADLIKLIKTAKAITPAHSFSKTTTRHNPVPGEKWSNNQIPRRARGTAGGDRTFADCPVSTNAAPMIGVNCALHAAASEGACFGALDLTDFCLGSPMPSPEFIIVRAASFSDQLLVDLNMTPFTQQDKSGKEFFCARADKTVPGSRQAGLHARERVTSLLLKRGHHQTQPCMFTHNTGPTFFALAVDDYGVKCTNRIHFDRLVARSSQKRHVKARPIASG
jgi:hypothetical protein